MELILEQEVISKVKNNIKGNVTYLIDKIILLVKTILTRVKNNAMIKQINSFCDKYKVTNDKEYEGIQKIKEKVATIKKWIRHFELNNKLFIKFKRDSIKEGNNIEDTILPLSTFNLFTNEASIQRVKAEHLQKYITNSYKHLNEYINSVLEDVKAISQRSKIKAV